jgi:uncharacterized Ntn-hydrolase superfamily protein
MENQMRPLALACILLIARPAAATFSIVAVDPGTSEVGSAGASCVPGAIAFSNIHPGVGAVQVQAHWDYSNRSAALARLDRGWDPRATVDWLAAHDAQGTPGIRQYGIVDLVDGGRSAAYTGADCPRWAGQRTGPTYAVQGNILLGPEILASMERAFLETPGALAGRLMAALQAANVAGADTLCAGTGKPAISAFLRVARPGDPPDELYLDLAVNMTTPAQNPIDLLQAKYDLWLAAALSPAALDSTAARGEKR